MRRTLGLRSVKTFSEKPKLHDCNSKLTDEQKATRRLQRFWAKVKFAPPDQCWEWIASRDRWGYGWFQKTRAHTFSWSIHYGVKSPQLCVLHKCDNPACVNPAHLFLGTQLDNLKDCVIKGRNPHGEGHWKARLSVEKVKEARHLFPLGDYSITELAMRYGVSHGAMYQALNQMTWKTV